jgi:pimeloyl-ACP methyl ester carboxylesterase
LAQLEIGGVSLAYRRQGTGPTLLVLHDEGQPLDSAPFVDFLARQADVIAPVHPGFAGAPRPEWIDTVADLAYLYNELLDELGARDVTVVGLSMGGWIAAEMAVRCAHRLAGLVLVGALGIKLGDRETREIQDIFANSDETLARWTYHDPAKAPDVRALSDAELEAHVHNREAAALYLWEPYAHNPKLRRRLERLDVPTLVVWGESDALAPPAYGRGYAAAIPGAEFALVREAGHLPHREQPERLIECIAQFTAGRRMQKVG